MSYIQAFLGSLVLGIVLGIMVAEVSFRNGIGIDEAKTWGTLLGVIVFAFVFTMYFIIRRGEGVKGR